MLTRELVPHFNLNDNSKDNPTTNIKENKNENSPMNCIFKVSRLFKMAHNAKQKFKILEYFKFKQEFIYKDKVVTLPHASYSPMSRTIYYPLQITIGYVPIRTHPREKLNGSVIRLVWVKLYIYIYTKFQNFMKTL